MENNTFKNLGLESLSIEDLSSCNGGGPIGTACEIVGGVAAIAVGVGSLIGSGGLSAPVAEMVVMAGVGLLLNGLSNL